MKLDEHELLALLTGLNSLTRAEETHLVADVNKVYQKVDDAYQRVRRASHDEYARDL